MMAGVALVVSAPATAQGQQLQSYHVVVSAYGETLFERTLTYLPGVGGDQVDARFHVPLSSESNGVTQATAYRSLDVALDQPDWDTDGTSPLLTVTIQIPVDLIAAHGGDPRILGGSIALSESLSLRPGETRTITASENVEIRVERR